MSVVLSYGHGKSMGEQSCALVRLPCSTSDATFLHLPGFNRPLYRSQCHDTIDSSIDRYSLIDKAILGKQIAVESYSHTTSPGSSQTIWQVLRDSKHKLAM